MQSTYHSRVSWRPDLRRALLRRPYHSTRVRTDTVQHRGTSISYGISPVDPRRGPVGRVWYGCTPSSSRVRKKCGHLGTHSYGVNLLARRSTHIPAWHADQYCKVDSGMGTRGLDGGAEVAFGRPSLVSERCIISSLGDMWYIYPPCGGSLALQMKEH